MNGKYIKTLGWTLTYYFALNGTIFFLFKVINVDFFDTTEKIHLIEAIPAFLILLFIIIKHKIYKPILFELKTCNCEKKFLIKSFFLIILTAILLRILNDPVYRGFEIFGNLKVSNSTNNRIIPIENSFFLILNFVIIMPILEELFFRRLILKYLLNRKLNIISSILSSSLLFAAIHFNPLDINYLTMIAAFILGIFCCIIFLRYGLLSSILFHISYNVLWYLLLRYRYDYRELINKLDYGLAYWSIILVSFVILVFLSKKFINGYSRGIN